MNLYSIVLDKLTIFLLGNILSIVAGEYLVNDTSRTEPSYLFHKFYNIKENIFPNEIRIQLHMKRIEGTLLYSIDGRRNQLIVTLSSVENKYTLGIEFRKKSTYFPLNEICSCERCKFEPLDITIQIKDKVYIKCNNGSRSMTYMNIPKINKAYPNPNISAGEANIWLINTENGRKDQLLGCIFNFWYNNEIVNFSKATRNIYRKCERICNQNPCNKGQCLESFNHVLICDCKKTFLNGDFCNKTLFEINVLSRTKNFQFVSFKVAWKSSYQKILTINNSNIQIRLYVRQRNLIFEISFQKKKDYLVTLYKNYNSFVEHIFIVTFKHNVMDIEFNNGSWNHYRIQCYIDIIKERFSFIALTSGYGVLSFNYLEKYDSLEWSKICESNCEEISILEPTKDRFIKKPFSLTSLRIAWQNSSQKIFNLKYTNLQLELLYDGFNAFFEYNYKSIIYIKIIIFTNYSRSKKHEVILSLNETFIEIKVFNNRSWNSEYIPCDKNLRNEIFTSMTFSEEGMMSIRYKNETVFDKWIRLRWNEKNIPTTNFTLTTSAGSKTTNNDKNLIFFLLSIWRIIAKCL